MLWREEGCKSIGERQNTCERQDNDSDTVKMQGEELAKVEDLKYLGSTVQSNGECGREVKNIVQA